MYYYIYVNPTNEDEKQLRYYAWIYSAILQRSNFPAKTEFGKAQKLRDNAEIKRLKEIIQNLTSFKNLSHKQQMSLLDSGSGKLFNHWATILNETGFTEKHGISIMYAYLSMYAHSEGLSAIQLDSGAFNYEKNKEDANLDLHTAKLLVCLLITGITRLFKSVEAKFKTLDENTQTDIEFYTMLALSLSH